MKDYNDFKDRLNQKGKIKFCTICGRKL